MIGVKFVSQANHVLSVLVAEHGWSKSQRELSQVTGIRTSLLSEIISRLEQAGRVRHGEPLPGPGRQRALVVVSASPLTQVDLRGAAVQDPPGAPDELGTSVLNLLRELTERLSEAQEEARLSDQRLQDARQSRADDRIRSDAEILRLKDHVQQLEREVRRLRGGALPGEEITQGPRRSVEELEEAARQMLDQLEEQ